MRAMGLPDEAAVAFLFGFFRRDYGAAGLYDLKRQGLLAGNQLARGGHHADAVPAVHRAVPGDEEGARLAADAADLGVHRGLCTGDGLAGERVAECDRSAPVICPMCNKTFDDDEARKECKSCALFGGCKMLKCPNCGYEMPQETRLVKAIRKWRSDKNARSRD